MLSPQAFSRPSDFQPFSSPSPFLNNSNQKIMPMIIDEPNLKNELNELQQKLMNQASENDKLSLILAEKNQEIDFLKQKLAIFDSNLSSKISEVEKLNRFKLDLEENIEKWKQKYSEFEKIFLSRTDECENAKIKQKKQEKSYENIAKEMTLLKENLIKLEKNLENQKNENEKLKSIIIELENEKSLKTDEFENLINEFENFRKNQIHILEEAKVEALKTIEDVHYNQKTIYKEKTNLETKISNLLQEIRNLNEENHKKEIALNEGEGKIIDFQERIGYLQADNDKLRKEITEKEINLHKIKTEYNNGNLKMSLKTENEPDLKYLQNKTQKQQIEILELKKLININEKFKDKKSLVDAINSKDEEIEQLYEKLKSKEKNNESSNEIKIKNKIMEEKLFLISVENERLHNVIESFRNKDLEKKIHLQKNYEESQKKMQELNNKLQASFYTKSQYIENLRNYAFYNN